MSTVEPPQFHWVGYQLLDRYRQFQPFASWDGYAYPREQELRRDQLSREAALVLVAKTPDHEKSRMVLDLLRPSTFIQPDSSRFCTKKASSRVLARLEELEQHLALSLLTSDEVSTLEAVDAYDFQSWDIESAERCMLIEAHWRVGYKLSQLEHSLSRRPIAQRLSALLGEEEWDDDVWHFVLGMLGTLGRVLAIELLLATGASATISDEWGMTPLHLVACGGDGEQPCPVCWYDLKPYFGAGIHNPEFPRDARLCVRLATSLVSCRADPEARDSYGTTPLQWAASVGCLEGIEAMLACGADPFATNPLDGLDTIGYAAALGIDLQRLMPVAGGCAFERKALEMQELQLPTWPRSLRDEDFDKMFPSADKDTIAADGIRGLQMVHARWVEAPAREAAAFATHYAVRWCDRALGASGDVRYYLPGPARMAVAAQAMRSWEASELCLWPPITIARIQNAWYD